MSLLRVERDAGLVVLTLNDPARRNVLSARMCGEISAAIADAVADPDARALLVTGEGPAFCAGADLAALEAAAAGDAAEVEAVYKAFIDLAGAPLPTVAAVNGPAVGAGMNLALAADWRIAAAEARFDTRFLKLGLHPGGGHGWMLLRAVGWAASARLLLGGQAADATEALRIGLVEAVVPGDVLVATARDHLAALVASPRELVLRTKASLREAAASDHAAAFARETEEQRWSLGEPAFAELVARARRR